MRKETTGIFSGPVRRRLSPDDEFFDEGNVQRALLCKISVFALLEQGQRDEGDLVDIVTEGDKQPAHVCTFPDCFASFSSLKRLEAHYETSHRNRCATCDRSFPSNRLLDLHLSEAHDSFFKAMSERKPMYVCLVEGCKEAFWSTGKRHAHLVEIHRYPESFDFSRSSFTRRKKGHRVNIKRHERLRRKQQRHETEAGTAGSAESSIVSAMETEDKSSVPDEHQATMAGGVNGVKVARETTDSRAADRDGDMEVEDVAGAQSSLSKCHRDRTTGQRQRLPRRCKYWRTSEGCRAGSECKFRHDAAGPPGVGERKLNGPEQKATVGLEGPGAAIGVEDSLNTQHRDDGIPVTSQAGAVKDGMDTAGVDKLVEGMKKISIPANLSFGRAARRGRPIYKVKR